MRPTDSDTATGQVHVVVTCTDRKTLPVEDHLKARNLPERGTARAVDTWMTRLSAADSTSTPALDLYAGEHWQIVKRNLPEKVGSRPVQLWICSAGYGLIPADAPVHSYAATFAPRHQDSVAETREEAQDWWTGLARWQGPTTGAPRSLHALVRSNPDSHFVVVMSGPYLRACSPDLLAAGQAARPGQFTILSTSAVPLEVSEFAVTGDGRLRDPLGGSLLALNARMAARLLTDLGPAAPHRKALAEALARIPVPERFTAPAPRTRMTDDEVRAYIVDGLAQPGVSATSLLRQLRTSGRACEQARFGELFREVVQR